MSIAEQPCGRLGMHTISLCADRAAALIAGHRTPRAVCLSPDGFVTVEHPGNAIPCDIVGVYDRQFGTFKLWGMIEADLVCAAKDRHIIGGTKHRHRVAPARKAA